MIRLTETLLFLVALTLSVDLHASLENRFFTYTENSTFKTDDGSRTIAIHPGIPFKGKNHQIINVCANGMISLGTMYCTYTPNMKSPHDLIAPFWSDLDFRANESRVAYSQHKENQDNTDMKVLQETRDYVSMNTNQNDFYPTIVVMVTWIKAYPYSYSSYQHTNQRVTFQLNLATDGKTTYAIFIYKDAGMLWNNIGRVPHVGYGIAGDTVDMSLTINGTYPIYRFDSVLGNTGKKGQWIWEFHEDSEIVKSQKCRQWKKQQPTDKEIEIIQSHTESECPCRMGQVRLDPRFSYWYKVTDRTCYRQRGIWYFKGSSTSFFTVCCYHSTEKWLYSQINRAKGITTQIYVTQAYSSDQLFYRYYRSLARAQAMSDDSSAFQHCCCVDCVGANNLCKLYMDKRPIPNCQSKDGYHHPALGWSGGDPHIRTLDGYMYTFNGIGDYTLLSISNSKEFEVHCRMSKAFVQQNATAAASKATVFSGFAMTAQQGALVEIYMNISDGNLTLLVNKQRYNTNYFNATETINGTEISWKSGNRTQLSVTFESGARAVVNVFEKLLTIQITALPSYINKTRGLFGVYNNDMEDDLTRPDGSHVSINASQKIIYYQFGKLWNVTGTSSLFSLDYPDLDSTFEPLFFDNINDLFGNNTALKEKAISVCGKSNFECLFDILMTGDTKSAVESKSTLEETVKDQIIFVTNPPIIVSPMTLELTYQKEHSFQIVATSESSSNLIYSIEATGADVRLDSRTGRFRIVVNKINVTLKFVVRDENNLAAAHSPTIQLCYCMNRAACNASFANTQISSGSDLLTFANCSCATGFVGQFCQFNNTFYCQRNPCFPGVVCRNNSVNFIAECGPCPAGYSGNGKTCRDIDECGEGRNNCHRHAACTNTVGKFNCSCKEGFVGDGTICRDIDECVGELHDCHKQAICRNVNGTFTCKCKAGFSGNGTLCQDIDECGRQTNKCHSHATCENTVGKFTCRCKPGYYGDGILCKALEKGGAHGKSNATLFIGGGVAAAILSVVLILCLVKGLKRRKVDKTICQSPSTGINLQERYKVSEEDAKGVSMEDSIDIFNNEHGPCHEGLVILPGMVIQNQCAE